MARIYRSLTFIFLVASLNLSYAFDFPSELTASHAIDQIMQTSELEERQFTFNVFDDGATAFSFLEVATGARYDIDDVGKDESVQPPINCETICKPVKADDNGNNNDAASFFEVDKRICNANGGKWSQGDGTCEAFMQVSKVSIEYVPEQIFTTCEAEFGLSFLPCSPHQAVGLSSLYALPNHGKFWVWPGGRFDQVRRAALKQDIGHNPRHGMDKCPEGHHAGFAPSSDEASVDNWSCVDDSSKLKVLCCAQG